MQELTSTQVNAVVGGNLLTGWVPPNWPGLNVLDGFQLSLGAIGVNISGPVSINIPGVQQPSPLRIGIPSGIPFSEWDC